MQSLQIRLSACIDHDAEWMLSNLLQLNAAKTMAIWSTTSRHLHSCRSHFSVLVPISQPTAIARNLGIYMRSHVMRTVSSIHHVCHFASTTGHSMISAANRRLLQQLMWSLVLSRLYNCHAALSGIAGHL